MQTGLSPLLSRCCSQQISSDSSALERPPSHSARPALPITSGGLSGVMRLPRGSELTPGEWASERVSEWSQDHRGGPTGGSLSVQDCWSHHKVTSLEVCLGFFLTDSLTRVWKKKLQRGPTRDLEACLDGGAPKETTLAGASFSMEWRLCEDARLSECDLAAAAAAEMGRKFGGAGDDKGIRNRHLKLLPFFCFKFLYCAHCASIIIVIRPSKKTH